MKKYLLIILFSIITLLSFSQRDIIVIDSINNNFYLPSGKFHKVTFVVYDTMYITKPNATDIRWSDNLANYYGNSRLRMAYSMDNSLDYLDKSDILTTQALIGSGIATGAFIWAAYSNPIVYIESHSKYTKSYYNDAETMRNIKVAIGIIATTYTIYKIIQINRYKKKAKWMIYPDNIKYPNN